MAEEKTPLKWKFEVREYSMRSSPLLVDDVIYFGSGDNHYKRIHIKCHLYAVDIKTGEEIWKFETGGAVTSSPTLVDGVVYFGSGDKHLYALDAKTGKEKWKFETGGRIFKSPTLVDGVVYFGSLDSHLYAVDIKTGKEKWKFKTDYDVRTTPAVVNGVVYFGNNTGYLYAVDANTGEEKWKFYSDSVLSSPAVVDGVVFFGSHDHHLYALDSKTGEEKWKYKMEKAVEASPIVVDGVVYCGGGYEPHLYAVDAKTGEVKWKFKTGYFVRSSPAIVDGVVYFGSGDKHLYALNAKTGEEKWVFKTGDSIFSSPAVSDGVVYFGSDDSHLYAVDIELAEKLRKEEQKRQEEEKKALSERQEEADKHGLTVEDIRTKYVSGDITLEEAIEWQKQHLKEIAEASSISAEEIVQAIWNIYGQPYDKDTPKSSILNYKYETEVKHIEADYISSDGLGCERLDEYNCGSDCHNIDKESDEYNPKEMEKIENIEITVWDYIVDNFESDFNSKVNASTLTGELNLGLQTKEAIEEILNNMMNDLCEIFRGFTVMGGEVLYPEQGDNPWEHPETIYLGVSAPKVSLEDLNPDWTEDKYTLVD